MLNFFRVGSRAARNQLLAATTVSVVAIIATRNTWLIGLSSSPDGARATMNFAGEWLASYRLVAWSDVILAAGFSLTCTGGFDETVENMKRASRQMNSREPRRPLKILVSLLSLSAVLGGILALQPLPTWLAQGDPSGVTGFAVACIWPGLISTLWHILAAMQQPPSGLWTSLNFVSYLTKPISVACYSCLFWVICERR